MHINFITGEWAINIDELEIEITNTTEACC